MTPRKRIGIPPHLYCDPLLGGAERHTRYSIAVDGSAKLAQALHARTLDLAFLAPLDYARNSSLYYVIPGIAVTSSSATGTITIHFRKDLRKISTLAVDPSSASEIVLARIILGEQFGLKPSIVPTDGSLDEGLRKADAALLVGDPSLRARPRDEQSIDLVEEWYEMTDLPYLHGCWCGRERGAGSDDIAALAEMRDTGVAAVQAIATEAGGRHDLTMVSPGEIREILEGLQYEMTEEAEEGLTEFLRYAYYHGILTDVADLQYFSPSDEREEDHPGAIH